MATDVYWTADNRTTGSRGEHGKDKDLDVLHEAKQSAARLVGVTTAQEGAQKRLQEANAAIEASNLAVGGWKSLLQVETFPAIRRLEQTRQRALDALALSESKTRAYYDYFQQNRDDLRNLQADTAALNLPALEVAKQNLRSARIGSGRVPARSEWVGLGVSVEAGWLVAAWARGSWKPGPNWTPCGPEGTDETSAFGDFRLFGGSMPLMCLLIRNTGDPNEVTGALPHLLFREQVSGDLQARCNDRDTSNNEGELEVIVVACPY